MTALETVSRNSSGRDGGRGCEPDQTGNPALGPRRPPDSVRAMKRALVWGVLACLVWLVAKNLSGKKLSEMRARCSDMCEGMLRDMPESFPPNRITSDLDHIRKQTDRIVTALHADGGSASEAI